MVTYEVAAIDEENDLVALYLGEINCLPLILRSEFEILNPILTIGYPPVPTSKNAYPLFHLGEINSNIETYFGFKLFLFSAKTNPGNSGGPVIDEDGLVIGIVTQLLEERDWYKYSKLPYCAAIPAKTIINFLVLKNLIDGKLLDQL